MNETPCNRRDFLRSLGTGCAALAMGASITPGRAGSAPGGAGERGREARFYEKSTGGMVICRLCPWECNLTPGQQGRCRARGNRDGRLHSLVYGKAVSIHVDPVEKKPFYHFLPGRAAFSLATAGCNLSCSFCQNWEISQASPDSIPSYDAPPQKLVESARREKAPIIAYTYTEPVVFAEYVLDTARAARALGIRNVMVSAGFVNPLPLQKLCGVLDAVKIDLKAFTQDFYDRLTGGRLQVVLNSLAAIRKSGTWLEIVCLVIPGRNDDPGQVKRMAAWILKSLGPDVPLHFTRFVPMYKLANLPPTPVKTLEACRNIALAAGLRFVYVGNVPGHPGNNTHCPGCKRVVIERQAYTARPTGMKNGHCAFCGRVIPGVWS